MDLCNKNPEKNLTVINFPVDEIKLDYSIFMEDLIKIAHPQAFTPE